jgi:hypothetical protein
LTASPSCSPASTSARSRSRRPRAPSPPRRPRASVRRACPWTTCSSFASALADELADLALRPGIRTVVLRPARLSAYRDAVARFVETREEAEWIGEEDREPLARLRGLLVPLEELCAEALRAALSPAPRPC